VTQPIKYSYWVEPNKLLAGEYPRNKDDLSSQEKLSALLRSGVTVFIDLTEENEDLEPYSAMIDGASHHRFPIRDLSIPKSPDATVAILDAIDRQIERGDLVYVHCWGGVGRTGVIVGCWLARHGLGGEAALVRLRELWRQCPKSVARKSPETREQELYILNWEVGR
jgi:protein-tyrosine phosphatase